MEYIYMIIRYKIVQYFNGIRIAVESDEQVFVRASSSEGLSKKPSYIAVSKALRISASLTPCLKVSELK